MKKDMQSSDPLLRYTVKLSILKYDKEFNLQLGLCSGVLISDRHILTAAHCVLHDQIKKVIATVGGPNGLMLNSNEVFRPKLEVESIAIHSEFISNRFLATEDSDYLLGDLAVLKLRKRIDLPFTFGFRLPFSITRNLSGEVVILTGYGLGKDTQTPFTPRKSVVQIWRSGDGQDIFWFDEKDSIMLGDSGGSVWMFDESGQLVLIGINSFSKKSGNLSWQKTTGAVDIRMHLDWIERATSALDSGEETSPESIYIKQF